MRYAIAALVLIALLAVAAHAAEHTYVVQFSTDGGVTWTNAPDQYIYGDWPTWPDWPRYTLYLSLRDARLARNTGAANHPEVEWQVYELP